ncbi:MAG: hypothetical protein A2494_01035 [Candidatus Lloydbacteria bacterium RIFOXYC12_FULL_46_25]|uniref:Inner membrane protein YgaP-like transmembrane domain-containing protein n=1 Tax=Candidatus Lloydbacteria bacterium RIFOXYC12_FULL_46_25 TaxID=1798670 RepID=A0A1G2E0D1_9BACT|nr:MAG: hypothetical protein A2494_01035 [Candidatus Lloydbacteria bacterium RIFOXYC12_FULL_46_25]
MKKNISIQDKRIRLTVGAVALALGVYFQSWWGVLGLPLLLTGWMSSCPLYTIIGISTDHTSGETCTVDPVSENKESPPEAPQVETGDQKPL